MDRVDFDGVQYVKASVLAKQFKYTQDYIGQLCRAKKVDARLIGRSWFVNPESITQHKSVKYMKVKDTSRAADKASKLKPSRKLVPPVVKNKTSRLSAVSNEQVSSEIVLPVSYERDDEMLVPTLMEKVLPPAKYLPIELSNSTKVKVVKKSADVSFEAGELPDVALSGTLVIGDFPNIPKPLEAQLETESEESLKNKNESAKKEEIEPKQVLSVEDEGKIEVEEEIVPDKQQHITKVEMSTVKKPGKSLKTQPNPVVSFSPKLTARPKLTKLQSLMLISPLIATVMALLCVLFIFSAGIAIESFGSGSESKLTFQLATLLGGL